MGHGGEWWAIEMTCIYLLGDFVSNMEKWGDHRKINFFIILWDSPCPTETVKNIWMNI